ncbi:hypothetical protein HYPBUDRAFT_235649 [Hyphopichia burtonii NRRL Y-1933]|uniref:Uncharacterized protein n=1 Tax=Hyphopichia burtonii NRRL Y-1933 TaxID=984485 RepID=A0A1E4RCQ3_9ASCO|nr:hypothetical protein HYPBUDRAFT_235649 [Hyphopichia burtonii NRRL Y-1933]ODV65016.1 hypothetical protein HYPBUDRAFT_235649 [Hyphopichia burtonii NRRL Y-1933]
MVITKMTILNFEDYYESLKEKVHGLIVYGGKVTSRKLATISSFRCYIIRDSLSRKLLNVLADVDLSLLAIADRVYRTIPLRPYFKKRSGRSLKEAIQKLNVSVTRVTGTRIRKIKPKLTCKLENDCFINLTSFHRDYKDKILNLNESNFYDKYEQITRGLKVGYRYEFLYEEGYWLSFFCEQHRETCYRFA